jgi:ADP-ribosylation factor-like protein 13B
MFTLIHNFYKYCKKKSEKELSVVILGLDNAGKSTLLSVLKGAVDHNVTPTWGFSSETIADGPRKVTYFDLGGGAKIRGIWPRYFAEVYAAIFVVDAADGARLAEAKEALFSSLDDSRLSGKPILILANKQDLPNAKPADEIALALGLDKVTKSSYRIIGGVAKSPEGAPMDSGVQKGMKWLTDQIANTYHEMTIRVARESAEQKELEKREADERRARVEKMREERRKQQELEEQMEKQREEEAAKSQPTRTNDEPSESKREAPPAIEVLTNESEKSTSDDVEPASTKAVTVIPSPTETDAESLHTHDEMRSSASMTDINGIISEEPRTPAKRGSKHSNSQELSVSVNIPGAPSPSHHDSIEDHV